MAINDKDYFARIASRITGTPANQIKVISYEIDSDGRFSGLIEIDGNRERIHEYSC